MSDSFLGIYCTTWFTTSGYPKYGESVTYGERNELECGLSVVNEEGTQLVFLPENFNGHVVVELSRDSERIPAQMFEVEFSPIKRKYAYHPQVSERDYDPRDFRILEPGIGVRTRFILRHRGGTPFPYGVYELICYFNKGSVKFEGGTDWRGRGGRGGSKFRIAEVDTLDDAKRDYIIRGGEYLRKDRPEKALRVYRKLIELMPGEVGAYAWLGQAYLRMERYQDAIAAYEKALPTYKRGERTSVPYDLAFCYVAVHREQKAGEVLREFFGERGIEETIRGMKTVLERKRDRRQGK